MLDIRALYSIIPHLEAGLSLMQLSCSIGNAA